METSTTYSPTCSYHLWDTSGNRCLKCGALRRVSFGEFWGEDIALAEADMQGYAQQLKKEDLK